MDVDHEPRLLPRGMHGGVDHIARCIDPVGALHDDIALKVDLDKGRRGDLVEVDAEGVDQEMVLGPGHAGGDVREDQVVPLLQRDQAVERRQVHSRPPFGLADQAVERTDSESIAVGHGAILPFARRLAPPTSARQAAADLTRRTASSQRA